MDGHIGYYAVFTMLALLEIISAAISLIVAVETMGIARKIKDKGLFRLGVGYAVMCIALVLGFTATLVALLYPVNRSPPTVFLGFRRLVHHGFSEPPPRPTEERVLGTRSHQ